MASTKAVVICEDIAFSWAASNMGISLCYTGSAAELIEHGAIEPEMALPVSLRNNRSRVDSRGHYFHSERRATVSRGAYLHVERWITDQSFASTLPGCPRLRFKDLDWLDAHPGRLLLRTEYAEDHHNRPFKVVKSAGTYDSLAASGLFPEEEKSSTGLLAVLARFKQKPSVSGKKQSHYSDGVYRSDRSRYLRWFWLMRGYYGIEDWRTIESGELQSPLAKPPTLRLVVDNTKEGSTA